VDSSGLRFTYTNQVRKFDAGIILAGFIVSGIQHLIPPNTDSFLSYGECSESCLREVSYYFEVVMILTQIIDLRRPLPCEIRIPDMLY